MLTFGQHSLPDGTRRWHVTISCQPDGRPPLPVRLWKSGRVHLAEGSNACCFRITVFYGVRAGEQKVCEWSENMENLMTVVDRLDELQASLVGRRECSSTRQRTGARGMDVHVDTYSQPCSRATGCGHCPCRHMWCGFRKVAAFARLCVFGGLCVDMWCDDW